MKQPLYIEVATAISPQHTFERGQFLQPVMTSGDGRLRAVEPDFRAYINPVAIRRMSRLMKMAISAAIRCAGDAGMTEPNAIITGTGRGSMTDMEHFLNDMIRLDEGPMNPTAFIQSTYNSPNGWIALQLKSTAYNQTFVHRGNSLELALLDAQLLFADADGKYKQALVGCYDELTSEYYRIKGKVGYWREVPPQSTALLEAQEQPGTIGGEGVAFFALGSLPGKAVSVVRHLELVQGATVGSLRSAARGILAAAGLTPDDISVVLAGRNGDTRQDGLYDEVLADFGPATAIAGFKHLCGEFDTAAGFGIWLADHLLRTQTLPGLLVLRPSSGGRLRHILLVNHYILGNGSVMLISLADDAS